MSMEWPKFEELVGFNSGSATVMGDISNDNTDQRLSS